MRDRWAAGASGIGGMVRDFNSRRRAPAHPIDEPEHNFDDKKVSLCRVLPIWYSIPSHEVER